MSTLFRPTETWTAVGLRTLHATVMLMLLVSMLLVSWYAWTHLLPGGMIGPDPDRLPINELSPGQLWRSMVPASH